MTETEITFCDDTLRMFTHDDLEGSITLKLKSFWQLDTALALTSRLIITETFLKNGEERTDVWGRLVIGFECKPLKLSLDKMVKLSFEIERTVTQE